MIAALAVVAGTSMAAEARANGVNTIGAATVTDTPNGHVGMPVLIGKGHVFKVKADAWKLGRTLEVSPEI